MTRALLPLALAAIFGCATPGISLAPPDATRLERELTGEERFLRVSMYSTPFFKDASKRLLTPLSPELVRLLENPDGTPINPGPVEATWPAGTRVKILKVEFPSATVMTERVLFTPRTLAWIYLDLGGARRGPGPFVLVLRPGIKTEDEFRTELDRLLTRQDLSARLEAMGEGARQAIKTKTATVELSAEALEMTWGYPEARKVELDGTHRKETWTWAQGARAAVLVDGQVTQLFPTGMSRAPAAH
ncbi:MAG: hypothetical protein IT380_09195 [Myxococcales bacterium]|nr:hypothetical protein [Myxococcales bacterium]